MLSALEAAYAWNEPSQLTVIKDLNSGGRADNLGDPTLIMHCDTLRGELCSDKHDNLIQFALPRPLRASALDGTSS